MTCFAFNLLRKKHNSGDKTAQLSKAGAGRGEGSALLIYLHLGLLHLEHLHLGLLELGLGLLGRGEGSALLIFLLPLKSALSIAAQFLL